MNEMLRKFIILCLIIILIIIAKYNYSLPNWILYSSFRDLKLGPPNDSKTPFGKWYDTGMELSEEDIEPDYLRYRDSRDPIIYRFEPKVFDQP